MDSEQREQSGDRGPEPIFVTRGEVAGFLIQSVVLASSMAFTTGVVIRRLLSFPLSLACGLGLFAGMLCSYPTIRLLARADGITFSFVKWLVISFSAAAFASTAISVL